MEKKNRILLFSVLLIAFIGSFVWVLSPPQKDLANHLPLPDEKAYTVKVNQWLMEKKQAHERAQADKTPEKQAREAGLMSRIISSAEAAVKDIYFYGKIIDQYGEPVPGVLVKYKARSEYLAAGTGFGETTTDAEGRFNTKGAEGTGLSIREFIKPGYQFPGIQAFDNYQRFEDSVLWKNFSEDKPYVFKVWKIERYPEVIRSEKNLYLLTPDGRQSTFDLLAKGKQRFKKGVQAGDFTVSFSRADDKWSVRVEALNGGILETNDIYQNLAPESGYQKFVEYKFPINHSDTAEKKYNIQMRDGKYYGQMTIEFRAYDYRQGKAAIFLSYVVNLENGRDLAVKQK